MSKPVLARVKTSFSAHQNEVKSRKAPVLSVGEEKTTGHETRRRGVMAAAFWGIQKQGGLVFVPKTLWNRGTSGRRAVSGVLNFCLDLPQFTAF